MFEGWFGNNSNRNKSPETGSSWFQGKVKHVVEEVKENVLTQQNNMREAQMSMQIAFAREQLLWGSGLYSFLVFGLSMNYAHHRTFPKVAAIPLTIGGFMLSWIGDTAYGNKLTRVRKESEKIVEEEKWRLVPPKQMPTRKFYEKEDELIKQWDIKPVSHYSPFGRRLF